MSISKKLRGFAYACVIGAASSMPASAAVVYDTYVNHSSEIATAAAKLAGSLSTSASGYSGISTVARAAAIAGLSSSDILFLGQGDGTSAFATASDDAAIKSFVEGGGTLIKLWGNDLTLLNAVADEAFVFNYAGIVPSTKTAAAAGTSFDSVVATLTGASDHGGITLASIGGATTMYENGSLAHVVVKSVGAGHVAFLSWDWCCSATTTVRNEWDDALLAAATYDGGAAVIPLPAGLPLLGAALAAFGVLRRRKVA